MNQHLERIDGLAAFLHAPVMKLIELAASKMHARLLVTQGWRSLQDQMLIYQKGRTLNRSTEVWEITDASQVVTRARPGTSAHNIITVSGGRASCAVDMIPFKDDGAPNWQIDDAFWDDLYELAWKVGLDPLGDPIGSYLAGDKGHFEEPAYKLKLEGLGLMFPRMTGASNV